MFSCFHNVELLLEPSFGQLEVKETAFGDVAGRSMHLTVNQEMKVRFFLPPLWKKLENVLSMA